VTGFLLHTYYSEFGRNAREEDRHKIEQVSERVVACSPKHTRGGNISVNDIGWFVWESSAGGSQ